MNRVMVIFLLLSLCGCGKTEKMTVKCVSCDNELRITGKDLIVRQRKEF